MLWLVRPFQNVLMAETTSLEAAPRSMTPLIVEPLPSHGGHRNAPRPLSQRKESSRQGRRGFRLPAPRSVRQGLCPRGLHSQGPYTSVLAVRHRSLDRTTVPASRATPRPRRVVRCCRRRVSRYRHLPACVVRPCQPQVSRFLLLLVGSPRAVPDPSGAVPPGPAQQGRRWAEEPAAEGCALVLRVGHLAALGTVLGEELPALAPASRRVGLEGRQAPAGALLATEDVLRVVVRRAGAGATSKSSKLRR